MENESLLLEKKVGDVDHGFVSACDPKVSGK
jgi:hypothetical protein